MRELDLLLERFLERGLDSLDDGQCAILERLLRDSADQDLLGWLVGAELPADAELAALVRIMRGQVR